MSGSGIVYMNDPNNITESLFFSPSQQMQDYITTSVQQYVAAVKTTAPDIAAAVQTRFNEIRSSAAVQYVKNIKHRLASLWQTDSIRFLSTIDHIQQAPDSMLKFVMAQPDLRRLYQNNGLSAYDNRYVDEYPDTIANTHYDYRRVTDGVIMQKPDGTIGYSNYYEHVKEGDILNIVQQTSILATWDILEYGLENEDPRDPTSVWNGLL